MNPIQIHPMIVSSDMDKTRDFYLALGGEKMWDCDGHLCFCFGPADQRGTISFYTPSCDGFGIEQKAFGGEGLSISIPAGDADQLYAELKAKGVPILQEPVDRPWKWRSFLVRDPNGVVLDFFEVLEETELQDATS